MAGDAVQTKSKGPPPPKRSLTPQAKTHDHALSAQSESILKSSMIEA